MFAGGNVVYTATCDISAAASGSLVNTATVGAPGGVTDTVPGNNSATDTDTLTPQADLAISKGNGSSEVLSGGQTTYSIVAANNGPSDVAAASVNDSFPGVLTCSWTCSGSAGGVCSSGRSSP